MSSYEPRITHPIKGDRDRQRGLSLVELMVAIALGGLLMVGAASLFVNNRQAYNLTADMGRLQESARFALETMVGDIRMAGYFGCPNDLEAINNITPNNNDNTRLNSTDFALEGIDDFIENEDDTWTGGAVLDADLEDDGGNAITVLEGADAITVRYLRVRWPESIITAATADTITVGDAGTNGEGIVFGAADCGQVAIFVGAVSEDDRTVIDLDIPLGVNLDTSVSPIAGPMVAVRYFIAENDNRVPALYRIRIDGDGPEELFTGVRDLQLLYGISDGSNRQPSRFAAAVDVNADEWSNVVSVKIGLLMETLGSARNDATPNLPTTLLDKDLTDFAFQDNRRYRVFTTTVVVRNL